MDREQTLAFANNLLDWGVPVIVCKPRPPLYDEVVPIVSWRNVTNAAQCRPMLEQYEHGVDALAMVGGYGIDLIDVDTKAGGSIEPFGDLRHYGITRTPSGGRHYVITSTGLRKIQGLEVGGAPVGDYIGGTAGHESRMLGFLPGSHRPKYGDVQYGFVEPWDVEGAVLGEVDEKVREILEAAGGSQDLVEVYVDDSPERDPVDGVHPYAQAAVDEELARLDALPRPWAPGSYWDDTTYEVACNLLRWANSRWTGYSEDDALADLLAHAPADDRWGERQHRAKWTSAVESVGAGGRMSPDDPRGDFEVEAAPRVKAGIDVTSMPNAHDFLFRMIGREGTALAGLFRRDTDLVYTPRVGEDGYVERAGDMEDGPMQIRRMSAVALCAYINRRYRVFRWTKGTATTPRAVVDAMFPKEPALQAVEAPELLESLRPLRAVSHTPVARADGSIMDRPGYDPASSMLFLPDRGLRVPDSHRGMEIVDEMLEGFPFVTVHDRANYLAALLTPLLRQMVPPPYPLIAIGAPQPGSGKGLLARLLRILHGGVFRSEMTRDGAELRKQITSILDTTSAPVVTFDNLTGVLRSPILDGLLTSAEWTDRILGLSEDRRIPNDRLWTITGNNLALGGDLKRRTVWVTIDPKMEHPEQRTEFRHPELAAWVEENRGEVLAALLGMVTTWVDGGKKLPPQERTDDFGVWQKTMSGILLANGVEGRLNHEASVRQVGLEDEDEWGLFLAAVERRFGHDRWQVKQVMAAVDMGDIEVEVLPGEIADKMRFDARTASKSLGRWVQNRADRWFDGRCTKAAGQDRNKVKYWRIATPQTEASLHEDRRLL